MKQLSFNDVPEVVLPVKRTELQETIDRNKAEIAAQGAFVRSFISDDEMPVQFDADWWEDVITRAVLKLNGWQREIEANGGDASSFIHAQDWLCRDLPEWCHDILREW